MRVLLLCTLALAACGGSDRAPASSTQAGSPTVDAAAAQALVLRIPRTGGAPRVYRYTQADSLVWTGAQTTPTPTEFLAFADEYGTLAYIDGRDRPVFLDLRSGSVTVASTKKLTKLASANGLAIFGIAPNGDIVRLTASGEWTFKPPRPARALYPQPDGGLLATVGTGANTQLLKLNPPDKRVVDSIAFPVAKLAVRTDLGDRLYLAVDSGLVVLRTRTMDWAPAVPFEEPIAVMASTPSGDRVFVLTDTRKTVSVVDRYRDRVTATFELPAKASALRVDAFGRYLLARAADTDSIWVLAIGTQKVIGALRGGWRADLPFVGYDGTVAVLSGNDVVLYDGETLKPRARARDSARDIWYPMLWDGFRPRDASLDEPVRFDSMAPIADSVLIADDTMPGADTGAAAADSAAPRGFVVSFAAFLNAASANGLAARIHVGGESARVITSTRDGQTVYRVILGPFLTREEAERAGKESGQSYWVYEGNP